MTIRAWKLNWKNLNYIDQDNSSIDYALLNSGIIEWFAVTYWQVAIGRAILITKRTSVTPNHKFGVHIEVTANEIIDTTWTKKVWIELDPQYVNDGTLATNPTWTQLAKINTGASYPADSAYYIPLASITGGVITDARELITIKGILRKGLTANTTVETWATWLEVLRTIGSGSSILSTETLRKKKADWNFEDVPFSVIQWSATGLTSEYVFGWTAPWLNASAYISALPKFRTWLTDVGKTTANSSFKLYSTWNAEQSFVLYFKKTGTPQDVTFRLETDNGSGSPSGSLINASAILVVAIASIPADWLYTITLPASINPWVIGTLYHAVMWQGASAISAVNYYSVWSNNETLQVYDKETWGTNVTATITPLSTNAPSGVYAQTEQITCTTSCSLKYITTQWTWTGWSSITITGGIYSNTSVWYTQSANTYTFNEVIALTAWVTYTITINGNGTYWNILSKTASANSAHISYVTWNILLAINSTNSTIASNLARLTTYISKADATTSIKSAVYGLLPSNATTWSYPLLKKDWYVWGFSGLVKWSTYYLSNTWVLSLSAWTVSKVIWVAISATTISIDSAINAS